MKGGKRSCVVFSTDEDDAKPENTKVNERVPKSDFSELIKKLSKICCRYAYRNNENCKIGNGINYN